MQSVIVVGQREQSSRRQEAMTATHWPQCHAVLRPMVRQRFRDGIGPPTALLDSAKWVSGAQEIQPGSSLSSLPIDRLKVSV